MLKIYKGKLKKPVESGFYAELILKKGTKFSFNFIGFTYMSNKPLNIHNNFLPILYGLIVGNAYR